MSIYIEKSCAFSNQENLEKKPIQDWKKGFIAPLETDFKALIQDSGLRRMPLVMKKSLAAASFCLQKQQDIGGISLATGMGCTNETLSFYHSIQHQVLKPSAFIQSTHNAISGKIAEYHQLHCPNLTHVHADTAFENALIEALTQLSENNGLQLIGAFDEYNQEYETIKNTLTTPNKLSEGVLFFLLSNSQKNATTLLTEVKTNLTKSALQKKIADTKNTFYLLSTDDLIPSVKTAHHLTYTNYSGEYNTATAFGLYMAMRILEEKDLPHDSNSQLIQNQQVMVINKSCHGYSFFTVEPYD